MNINLQPVEPQNRAHIQALYRLLKQRQPYQAISHKVMPTFEEHTAFVQSIPYFAWYLIYYGKCLNGPADPIGSVYLTRSNEIGIFLFRAYHGMGYGQEAVAELMKLHKGPYLANINPSNLASRRFFESLGFKPLQVTYSHE